MKASGYSFPSDHATLTSSVWSYLVLNIRRAAVLVLLITAVVLVGYSRVLLGVHYLTDVVVGTLLGITLNFLINYLYWRDTRKMLMLLALVLVPVGFSVYLYTQTITCLKVVFTVVGMLLGYLLVYRELDYLERVPMLSKLTLVLMTLLSLYLLIDFLKSVYTYILAGFITVTLPVTLVSKITRGQG